MADLNVNFIHPIDGRTLPVTLDDGINASEAVKELIQNSFLAVDPQGYNLVTYGGAPIQPNQTFREVGIRDNDFIRINHREIPKIENEIFKIRVNNQTKVTILLGSGASAPSGIPTVNRLLPELWKSAKKIDRDELNRLIAWCKDRKITNIEDLLTAAYIANFVVKNENVSSLLDYFLFTRKREHSEGMRYFGQFRRDMDESSIKSLQDTLLILFGLLPSTMISASPNSAHSAIVNFIKHHKNTSIITTNYDGCMDEAILREAKLHKKIIPQDNKANNNLHVAKVIKMHGAINWSCCDSCQDVHETDLLELKEAYGSDKFSYAVIGLCKNCGGQRRPLLVPPLAFKFVMFPNLIDIWNSARSALEKAHYLIVVGYSFSEADTYISKIISRSMSMNKHQKILIIDTNPNLAPTLREKFSIHIDNFDQARVLEACASCDKILPKILQSLLNESQPKNKATTTQKRKA